MKRRIVLWGVAIVMAMGVGPAAAQGRRADEVCFYKDVRFQGPSWCYQPGDELADLRDRRNEISSIRVTGRARVIVFDEREFMGLSDEFDRDVPDLTLRAMEGRRTWNDRIDSFAIVDTSRDRRGGFGRSRDDRRAGDARDDRAARDRICVYDRPNYEGRSQCWDAGTEESNLNRTNGWNDRIASIRVFGRTTVDVYRDADFRGARQRLDRDVPDLGTMNLSSQISSFQVR